MNTEIETTQETERQLRSLGEHIEEIRRARGCTKAHWLKTFPDLGTDKTYSKITSGNLAELDLERWLGQYQYVVHLLENATEDPAEDDLYDDLMGPARLCRAFLETARERGNARVLLLLGDSASGKSSAIRVLQRKPYGSRVTVIEATDAWKNRNFRGTGSALLRALARKLGVADLPRRIDDLLAEVVSRMTPQRRCIVIDEAHHLCPEGVNLIKHLVNQTPGEFILVALPSLWSKLESSREAWTECKQLTGNRLAERIVLTVDAGDVLRFVTNKLSALEGWTEALGKGAATELTKLAPKSGNYAFVRDVCKRVKRSAEEGEVLSQAMVEMAIRAELRSR